MRLPVPAILSAAVVSIAAVYFVVFQTGQSPLTGYLYYPDGGKIQWLGPGVYKIYSAGPCPGDIQIGGKCFHLKQTIKADDPGQLPVLAPDSLVEVDMEPRITYVDVYIPKYNNTFKLYVCTDGFTGKIYYLMYMESPLYTLWPTRASWVNGTDNLGLYTGSYYIDCTPVPTDVDRVQFTSSMRGLATHYTMTWDPSGSVSARTQRTAYVYAYGTWWWIPQPGSKVQVAPLIVGSGSLAGPACFYDFDNLRYNCYVDLIVNGDVQLPDPSAHIAWFFPLYLLNQEVWTVYSNQHPWSLSIGVGPPWPGGCGSLNGTIVDNLGNVYNISIPASASCYYGVPTFSWSSTNIGPGAYAYVRQVQEIALNYATGTSSISSVTPIISQNCTIPGQSISYQGWCYVVGVVYVGGTAHLDVTTLQSVGTFGSIYPPLDISTNVAGQPAVAGAYKDVAVVYAEPPLYNVTIYRYHTNLMDVLSLYGPQVVAVWRGENPMYYSNPLANSPYFYFVKVGPVYAANGVISAMPNIEVLQAVQSIDREQVMVLLTKPPPPLYAPSTS
jgi:hypothetical protein